MRELERLAVEQRVVRLPLADLDQQLAPMEHQPEREPRERLGQPRLEAERAVVVAHPAEPRDRADPGPGQRRDVQAVARVVLEVVEVDQRRLAEVVVGQLEVPDLGGEHACVQADSDESRTVSCS